MGNQYEKRRRPVTEAGRLAGRPAGWPEIVPRFLHPRMFLECFHRSRLAGRPANSSIGLLLKRILLATAQKHEYIARPPRPPAEAGQPAGQRLFLRFLLSRM